MQHSYKKQLPTTFLFILLFFISFCIQAQENSNYSLLWKIEGENSKKPSYLFGTMHLDDIRAFNFSDAVLPAIQNSEKFALEVQPDSLLHIMANQKLDTKAYLVFKELLNEKEYKSLNQRFIEINGFSLEDSDISDPDVLLVMFEPDEEKEDDKASFVDLHLLAHAKTMQKEIIGLESMNNQIGVFNKLSDENKKKTLLEIINSSTEDYSNELEKMINIYITGNIDAIDEYLISNDGYDDELTRRNEEMCESIIQEIENNNSLFSAVGAAHLPGKFGILNLLKKKGYTVTKVEANFTGVAQEYQIDDSKMLWHTYTNTDFGYRVQTPTEVTSEVSSNLNIYSSADLITEKFYSFFAIDIRNSPKKEDTDDLFTQIINNAKENYNPLNVIEKKTSIAGSEGYDITFELQNDEEYDAVRSLYLVKNDIFYQFFIFGDLEKVTSKAADKFFNSISFFEPKPLPEATNTWIDYHNDEGAFTIQLPNAPKDVSREVDSGIESATENTYLNMYTAQNLETGDNYIIRYNDLPIGYRIEDLEASFTSIQNSFLATSELLSEPKVIYKDGYEGREYELLIKKVSHGICKLFFRGNRTYLILNHKLVKGEKVDPNNSFFESFTFDDYLEENIVKHNTTDFSFNILENHMVKLDEDDYSDSYLVKSNDHYSKSKKSGDMFSFSYSKLKPYFKMDTLQNFYTINKEALMEYNDTLIQEKTHTVNNIETYEFTTIKEEDSIISKHVMWLDKDYFFITAAYTSKENINSTFTNNMLYGYSNKNSSKTIDYYASKTDLILKDLKSKDSLVFKNAIGAFEYYEFEEADLKKLYQAAKTEYPTTENKTLVVSKIITELGLINNENTLAFLKDLYNDKTTNDEAKREILELIPYLENNNRLEVYKNLFINNPPQTNSIYTYDLFTPFRDSTAFAIKNYKEFIRLKNTSNYKNQVINISSKILESNLEDKEAILEYFNNITDSAFVDVDAYLKMLSEEEYDYTQHNLIYNYLDYFKNIPATSHTDFIDRFTTPILTSKENYWIIYKAANTRITHNLPINKDIKVSLLENKETQLSMIKTYHEANKLNEIPNKYLNTKAFSKTSLKEYLNDSDEYPTTIEFLGELKLDKKIYHAYALNYTYEDPNTTESYLAVVYPTYKVSQEQELTAYPTYTYWDFVEKNWKEQSEELIIKSQKTE